MCCPMLGNVFRGISREVSAGMQMTATKIVNICVGHLVFVDYQGHLLGHAVL